MDQLHICLYALLFFFFLRFGAPSSSLAQHLCHPDDSLALLQFKETFHIYASNRFSGHCNVVGQSSYPKISSWNKSRDCCTWDGITCHEMTGHVIGLDLSCSGLEGAISPNSSLFTLSHLQKLNLAFNDFKGSQISHGFGGFTRLMHLNLSVSNFNGQISLEISHLSNLILLDLSLGVRSNFGIVFLNGYLLSWGQQEFQLLLQNLTHIAALSLLGVDISSEVPMNLSSSLSYLDLSATGVHGKLPKELFQLPKLQILQLSENREFTGSLPQFNCSKSLLQMVDLSFTNFSGELPNSIGCLISIESLWLSFNNFTGTLPESFENLSKLNSLHLNNNNFIGPLPKSIANLSKLNSLDLSFNHFIGPLPESFGSLSKLKSLDLSFNHFIGPLPESFGSLSKLNSLDLNSNHFIGPLHESIRNFSELNDLYLYRNNFTGPLPESIGNLSKLNYLDFHWNNFTGPLPESIGNLSKLKSLDLSSNNFIGPLPESIGNLSKLNSLDLSSNNFIGPLPESIGNLAELDSLHLSSNNFIAALPESIGNLSKLNVLHLSNNELYGQIPNSISKLLNLNSLDFSSNKLTGIVEPNMFSNLKQLEDLDLSDNMLIWRIGNDVILSFANLAYLGLSSCGLKEVPEFLRNTKDLNFLQLSNNNIRQIPTWFTSMPWDSLYYLNLSHNSLSTLVPLPFKNLGTLDFRSNRLQGPLSLSLCNLEELRILDISNNKLTGAIPQCFGNFSRELLVLELKNNGLQGKIALTFATYCQLTTLGLNGNLLEGPLPRSLSSCGKLEVLDVGNNNISDTFPIWLENLNELQVLILKSNRFFGPIGTLKTKNPFEKLRVIDISSNEFIGVLPASLLKSFRAMESMNINESKARYMETYEGYGFYQASIQLVMKGHEFEFIKILSILTAIDVSSNRFTGELPKVIGNLISLKFLNLSHNQFSGHIPSILGNLSSLESLDISCNYIEGEIPLQLTLLTSLSFLNLSQNHLEGRIPQGSQFNTFSNDSYIGNLGLCGPPLTKSCGQTEAPPPLSQLIYQQEKDSIFFSGFTWRPVIMGYSCGIVFGLAAGSLMFLTGKPELLVSFIEKEIYYCGLHVLSKKWVYKRFERPTRRGHKVKHKWGAHHRSNPNV